jgi:predicted transport protein
VSDLKLFRIESDKATELSGTSMALERSLQELIEGNMETVLGVRFLAGEFSTGIKHRGRIDSIGIDENGSPVIIEYKRALNENVINQGLFYLDWLLDHRGDFTVLVLEKLGKADADSIDWSNPRLICIAGDFTRYDEHAVQQIDRNIELIRYRRFGDELLALELLTAVTGSAQGEPGPGTGTGSQRPSRPAHRPRSKTVTEYLEQAPSELHKLFDDLEHTLLALGDDVQRKTLKDYIAYKRLKNFACVEVHPQSGTLLAYLKVDPATITLEPGFTRDVTKIGHYGTGNLEVRICSHADLQRALDLLRASYEAS